MTKLVLDHNVSNIDSALGPYNGNFQKLEDELQDKVLYRNNPAGEPNAMENPLDMNGERIYNLPAPLTDHEAARLVDLRLVADYPSFFYGPLPTDPTTRPDGTAIQPGDYYFNTTTDTIRFWNSNTGWNNAGEERAAEVDARLDVLEASLGTASTHDVQTSPVDDTPNSVMLTGAFGLGGMAVLISGTLIKANRDSGFYSYDASLTLSDKPTTESSGAFTQTSAYDASSGAVSSIILCNPTGTTKLFITSKPNIVTSWSDWEEIGAESAAEPVGSVGWWFGSQSTIPGGKIPISGQEVAQGLYPQLYAMVLADVWPTVDEATWQATPSARGSFVKVSSAGMFRMPDLNGVSAGAIDRVFLSGSGGSAAAMGAIQEDAFQGHWHAGRSGSSPGQSWAQGTGFAGTNLQTNKPVQEPTSDGVNGEPRITARTRPVNVAGIWVMKVADVGVNPGTVDIVALAAQASATDSGLQTLDGELDFTIIYPNGGTQASPANVSINTRYISPNPFPGHYVICFAEVNIPGEGWVTTGKYTNTTGASFVGAEYRAASDNIIVTTGVTNNYVGWNWGGGSLSIMGGTGVSTPVPCRVRVYKLKGFVS